MKLEDIKKEMAEAIYIDPPNQFTTSRLQYDRVTQYWLDKLDKLDLIDPDAKLRKVREEITASFSDLLKGLTAERSDQFWRNGLLTMLVKAQSIIDSHLTPSEPEVDEELEAARNKYLGKKVKWEYQDFKETFTAIKIKRVSENHIQFTDERDRTWGYHPYTKHEYSLLPLEPKWPDAIRDGWWIYLNFRDYYLTDKKPEPCSVRANGFTSQTPSIFVELKNFLAPLGLKIQDLEIPEVDVSERCWVKGGER